MREEWIRGYGQKYKHLVIREEKTVNGNCIKTVFACGQSTDCALDKLADWNNEKQKCPSCLRYFYEQ